MPIVTDKQSTRRACGKEDHISFLQHRVALICAKVFGLRWLGRHCFDKLREVPEANVLHTLPSLEKSQLAQVFVGKPVGNVLGEIYFVVGDWPVAKQVETPCEKHFRARMGL